MTQIQTILVIGSIILLSTLILTRGANTVNHFARTFHIAAVSNAFEVGQSVIEQINSVDFDENILIDDVKKPSQLSSVLGPEIGEYSLSHFDDVDDFKNYTWSDSTEKFGVFNAKINVSYCSNKNPNITTTEKSFYKKVEILITNKYFLKDTVRLQTIKGY